MARTEATLNTITFSNNYDPAHHIWTDEEHAALVDCKSTAEVIKKRLESNGVKIQEMYEIEHKGEKDRDTRANIDTTKLHYHVVLKFAPGGGATLRELAKYMGILPQNIRKPKPGGHRYDNMLSYLTHIKYPDKLQYPPENVVTLAGKDYMDYYNARAESWKKASGKVGKGKANKDKENRRLLREVIAKMDKGDITYDELRNTSEHREYRRLLLEPKYENQLDKKSKCVKKLASDDKDDLLKMIKNHEITSFDEITENEHWKLAYKYHKNEIDTALEQEIAEKDYKVLREKIYNYEITSLDEITENEHWKLAYKHKKGLIDKDIRKCARHREVALINGR